MGPRTAVCELRPDPAQSVMVRVWRGADVEVDAAVGTRVQSGLDPWFSPSPLLTLTVRSTNGNTKVGFVLTPTCQPRVYLVHSVHDVQGVPTRVKKGEGLDR